MSGASPMTLLTAPVSIQVPENGVNDLFVVCGIFPIFNFSILRYFTWDSPIIVITSH